MGDATLEAIELDESYEVMKLLAEREHGATELVMRDGRGPFVRKRIPLAIANRDAWEALAGIDDPRLPQVEAIYELPDELVVVYRYVEGQTVEEIVGHEGALPAERAAAVMDDVAAAAQLLHERGIVHRDITPANVVVDGSRAHLVDLGIARRRDPDASIDTTHLGTWGFAAPEQYGFAQTDARSDVWSMGRLLAYMLTGLAPDEEGFEGRLSDEGFVSRRMSEVISRACAFEPSARYASAEEFARAVMGGPAAVGARSRSPQRPVMPSASPRRRGLRALVADELADVRSANPIAELREAITSTSPLRLAPLLPIWVLFALWTFFVVERVYLTFISQERNSGPPYALMGIPLLVGSYLIYLELQRFVLEMGRYEGRSLPSRLGRLILALAVLSALTFVAMFAVAFIAAGVELALLGG